MFSSSFQTGLSGIEILSPSGKSPPVRLIKINGPSSLITKDYDREIKGYKYVLFGKGNQTSGIQCPAAARDTLALYQPLIVFQLKCIEDDPINLEIVVLDATDRRRRFLISSTFKTMETHVHHAQIPWVQGDRDVWTNVVFNLQTMTQRCFLTKFASIDSFHLRPACSLRKIFTLPMAILLSSDDGPDSLAVPAVFEFPFGNISRTFLFSLESPVPDPLLSKNTSSNELLISGLQIKNKRANSFGDAGNRKSDIVGVNSASNLNTISNSGGGSSSGIISGSGIRRGSAPVHGQGLGQGLAEIQGLGLGLGPGCRSASVLVNPSSVNPSSGSLMVTATTASHAHTHAQAQAESNAMMKSEMLLAAGSRSIGTGKSPYQNIDSTNNDRNFISSSSSNMENSNNSLGNNSRRNSYKHVQEREIESSSQSDALSRLLAANGVVGNREGFKEGNNERNPSYKENRNDDVDRNDRHFEQYQNQDEDENENESENSDLKSFASSF